MRLVRVVAVSVAVGSTVLLSGCGGTDVAAKVDGHVITEAQVAAATRQINEGLQLPQPLTPQKTLNFLIHAPVVLAYAEAQGHPQSLSAARAELPISDPDPATLDVLRVNNAYGNLTQADEVPLTQKLQAMNVEVNPKYGAYDAQTAMLGSHTPDWIKLAAAAQ